MGKQARCESTLLFTLLMIPMAASTLAESHSPETDHKAIKAFYEAESENIETFRAMRQANADYMNLYVPFVSFKRENSIKLYVISRIADPLFFELTAYERDGVPSYLGTFLVEPTQHKAIPLADYISFEKYSDRFFRGSLEMSFLGDKDTVQAWAVYNEEGGVLEIPFEDPNKSHSNVSTTFWSRGLHRGSFIPYFEFL